MFITYHDANQEQKKLNETHWSEKPWVKHCKLTSFANRWTKLHVLSTCNQPLRDVQIQYTWNARKSFRIRASSGPNSQTDSSATSPRVLLLRFKEAARAVNSQPCQHGSCKNDRKLKTQLRRQYRKTTCWIHATEKPSRIAWAECWIKVYLTDTKISNPILRV